MTDTGTVAMKWSNSKCICQTLNKFGAFIALNSNLRLITDSLKFSCSVIWQFYIKMTDIGTIALKCANSKCICQTLNKFGEYIALNQISDCSEFIWSLFAVLSGGSILRWLMRDSCNEMFKFEVYLSNAQ